MIFGVAIGVLAGTVLLVLATVIQRAGRTKPDNQLFAAMAALAGLHVLIATIWHLTLGATSSTGTLAKLTLVVQAVVAGLVVLFARAFGTSKGPAAWVWVLAMGAGAVGGWAAKSAGVIDDLPRATACIAGVPYVVATAELVWRAARQSGVRRSGQLAVAWAIVIRLGVGFVLAEHWVGPSQLLSAADSAMPWHAYLDVIVVIVIGLVVLRYHLLDVRRVFRETALPLGVGGFIAAYSAGVVAWGPWLERHTGAAGAALLVLLPPAFVLWAGWTWHDALERASAALDPRRRVRREVVERVVSVTGSVIDAEAVLAMVRASMLELFEAGEVQFWRAAGNQLMPGISRTLPVELEDPMLSAGESTVAGSALAGRVGGTSDLGWTVGGLFVPVRRNKRLYGVFELRIPGRTHSDELATAAALADHLAVKLENLQLYSFLGRAGRELSDVKRFLEGLIESLPVGVVALVGKEHRVRTWNPAEERRTGISKEAALGKRYLDEVAPSTLAPAIVAAIRDGAGEARAFPNVDWGSGDGTSSVDVTVAPFRTKGLGGDSGCVLIFADASERTALQRDLEEYRRLAALGQFAAAIAHDVRTPLSSMRMSVQILRSKVDLPSDDAEYFDLILESMSKLGRQVDELVEFTKPALPRIESVEVSEVVLDACDDLAAKARSKGVEVRPSVQPGLVAPMDEARVRKALANLLCNAIEASERGGVIEITGRMEGEDQVVFRVMDSGVGIEADDLERIWEPFFTRRPDGTGLGLAIVRKNVTAHGGTLTVTSEPGKGTTVEVRLPARRATEVVVPIDECRRVTAAE